MNRGIKFGRVAAIAAFAVVALAIPASAATDVVEEPASTTQTVVAAARKVALGVTMHRSGSVQVYDNYVALYGGAPALWHWWRTWAGPGVDHSFPNRAVLNHMAAQGTTPMISWQPGDMTRENRPIVTYRKILAGKFDRYIRKFARAAKAYRRPVMIRFAHEMDGAWFPWGVHRFDNTPAKFKLMWRYVWNKFRTMGVRNVRWLWNPNVIGSPSDLRSMYPGDQYVNYVGFSSFNWGYPSSRYERRVRPRTTWKALLPLIEPGVKALKRITNKPIVMSEIGATSDTPRGKSKAGWVQNGYDDVFRTYKSVKAIVYFNVDMRAAPNRHEDWRLGSAAREVYKGLMRQSRFQGHIR